MCADRDCLHAARQLLALGALAGAFHHSLRPIRGRDVMSDSSHAYGIQPRAATQVDQPAARRERRVQSAPHFAAHVLDQRVITSWSIVIRSDAVEGVSCFVELPLPVVYQFELRMK